MYRLEEQHGHYIVLSHPAVVTSDKSTTPSPALVDNPPHAALASTHSAQRTLLPRVPIGTIDSLAA